MNILLKINFSIMIAYKRGWRFWQHSEGIESSLGAGIEEVKEALFELVLEKKVREVGKEDYVAVDEVNVKRLNKHFQKYFKAVTYGDSLINYIK